MPNELEEEGVEGANKERKTKHHYNIHVYTVAQYIIYNGQVRAQFISSVIIHLISSICT